jgi:hypothetical protein
VPLQEKYRLPAPFIFNFSMRAITPEIPIIWEMKGEKGGENAIPTRGR